MRKTGETTRMDRLRDRIVLDVLMSEMYDRMDIEGEWHNE